MHSGGNAVRTHEISRKTAETNIYLSLNLDGSGKSEIATGCGFLDHMLTLFAKHGRFDLIAHCTGDTFVDDHHSVEDLGICLGEAFSACLGDKRGIRRYGSCILPMDESLVLCAVDLCGRDTLGYDLPLPSGKVGTFDTELAEEFWHAFVRRCGAALHIRKFAGSNTHHLLEASFKAAGRALREAVSTDPAAANEIPSTKGVLE